MQHECYVNSWWLTANSSLAFWNFGEIFFLSISKLHLVESADVEPMVQLCYIWEIWDKGHMEWVNTKAEK